MNEYVEILLVILIFLFIFFYWLPFARRRKINIDQERTRDHEPGGEEEYYRMLKEGKKYREELRKKRGE
ncbi:MAG: hypothetical protein ACP5UO_03055 [Thermoplasmata archaeon]